MVEDFAGATESLVSGAMCPLRRGGGGLDALGGGPSLWWHNILNIRGEVGEVNTGWLTDNIMRQVGDGESTLFWFDPWIDGKPLCELYERLFELA